MQFFDLVRLNCLLSDGTAEKKQFSVSVVFPASGWLIMAKVLLLLISSEYIYRNTPSDKNAFA
jgi:hypothetical protein